MKEARAHEHLQTLLTDFRARSNVAREAVSQAAAIRELVDAASFAPPSEVDSSSDDEGATLREDELARARDAALAMGGEEQADSDEPSGLALAAALVERQDVRETRRAATGRSAKKGAMDESMRIVYAPTVDVLENAEEADQHANELMSAVAQHEEGRNIQAMSLRYQAKEKPQPPGFDSTSLTVEMDTIVKQYAEIILSTETMLRSVMDPTGKKFQVNVFDGELARIRYHLDVGEDWVAAAKEHGGKYSKGANAITTGVTSQVAHVRKTMLELKEECDLLARQCERKKIECDVVARRQEGLMSSTVVRQVIAAGWRQRTVPGSLGSVPSTESALSPGLEPSAIEDAPVARLTSDVARAVPTIPRKYVRAAASKLRHHLTGTQSTIVRGVDALSAERDDQVLRATTAVIDILRSYENKHRDEEDEVAAADHNAELRQQLRSLSADFASPLTSKGQGFSPGRDGEEFDEEAAQELTTVETMTMGALQKIDALDRDDDVSRPTTPGAAGGGNAGGVRTIG